MSVVMNMEPEEWCTDITMCKAPSMWTTYGIDHCSACVDMVHDVSLIAQVTHQIINIYFTLIYCSLILITGIKYGLQLQAKCVLQCLESKPRPVTKR